MMDMDGLWQDLRAHAARVADRSIVSLFADPGRAARFSWALGDMLFDASKTQIDDGVLAALIALARGAGVEARRNAMFSGATINQTEGRAVLHTALRINLARITARGSHETTSQC